MIKFSLLRWVFALSIIAVLIGCVALDPLLSLEYFGLEEDDKLFWEPVCLSGWSVFVVVLYGWTCGKQISRKLPERSWNETQRSEYRISMNSVYFLGFLLTLLGLAYGISKFAINLGDARPLDVLLGNAIALSSTIAAMLIRTWINFSYAGVYSKSQIELQAAGDQSAGATAGDPTTDAANPNIITILNNVEVPKESEPDLASAGAPNTPVYDVPFESVRPRAPWQSFAPLTQRAKQRPVRKHV